MKGMAAGQAGSGRVNSLLVGFRVMPGESRTITITNPRTCWACWLHTGVEVKADADFPVKTDNMPLSYAGQLLAAMLQGAGAAASASKPTKRLPMTPRPVPSPPLKAPEMTRLATVSGETFRVRLAADVYVGSTGYKSKVVIFDDEVQLYAHPQGGR